MSYVLGKGFYVSFCGNVTYKGAEGLHQLVKKVPLERLLVETDAPYLAPVPMRGTRNNPANVRITAEFLAVVKGVGFESLAKKTTENAQELYGI